MRIQWVIFCYLLNVCFSFSIPTNYPLGKWIIKGTNTELHINNNEIVLSESDTKIKMKSNCINDEPLLVYLNSMEIQKYPKYVNRRIFTAINWIYKIQKHGIIIEVKDISPETKSINWKIDTKTGECIISQNN